MHGPGAGKGKLCVLRAHGHLPQTLQGDTSAFKLPARSTLPRPRPTSPWLVSPGELLLDGLRSLQRGRSDRGPEAAAGPRAPHALPAGGRARCCRGGLPPPAETGRAGSPRRYPAAAELPPCRQRLAGSSGGWQSRGGAGPGRPAPGRTAGPPPPGARLGGEQSPASSARRRVSAPWQTPRKISIPCLLAFFF